MYHGDIRLGVTLDIKFTTRRFSTGAPFTLAGSPVVVAYPDNGTVEITAGITLTVDFDGRTGLNNVRVIATAANGYAPFTNYGLVLSAGTVDSVSVVGEVVGAFSIENRSALMPTELNRTLDVSLDGTAGIDWSNISQQSTTVTLGGTTIDEVIGFSRDTGLVPAYVGDALGGSLSTVLLGVTASSVADFYKGCLVNLVDEVGIGQARVCTAYNGATKEATVSPNWVVAPDSSTRVVIHANADALFDISTRIPAVLVGGKMDSNVGSILGEVAATTALHRGVRGTVLGTVGNGSTTTSIVTSSLDPAAVAANQYLGRAVIFTRDTTTTALRGQAALILSSTPGGVLTTLDPMTTAPVSGDSFCIV